MKDATHNNDTTQARETNAKRDGRRAGKPRRFAWLFEEWVFQTLLVAAVVFVLVDGVSAINTLSLS